MTMRGTPRPFVDYGIVNGRQIPTIFHPTMTKADVLLEIQYLVTKLSLFDLIHMLQEGFLQPICDLLS